jgi:tetratricopeptide (TPR) repeat protein
LPPCDACNGRLFPLVLCDRCGAATILRDARDLDWATACSECGTFNPWQLICDQCHTRFPAPGVPAGRPAPAPENPAEEVATPPPGRPSRRIKGDVDTRALTDLLKVLGLDASRAQALVDRGYNALWKIARAKEDELARIPEVGPVAARKMIASFQLLNYAPPKRTKESIAQDEYACPLCHCVTAGFPPTCIECGATFEEEEMEEDIRQAFLAEGDASLLAFYDNRLAEKPDDAELSYARGLLLESMGRIDDAIAALDRAESKASDAKKIRVALLRVQAKHLRKPEVAEKLRSTAKALLDDVAWEQEVAQLDQLISGEERRCPHCEAIVPAEMALCPSCGGRLSRPFAPVPPKSREPSPTPELDAVVDDLLVGELEESLSEHELELTKAAVLDWLIEELEESMAPDTQVLRPTAKTAPEEEPGDVSPLTGSIGFISSWMRGSRGLVSGLRPKRGVRGGGKVNGLVNGKGRVNGLVNGVGRTNGLVNGLGRVNGLAQTTGRVNGLVTARGRVNGLVGAQGRINGIVNGTQFVRPHMKGLRLPYPSKRIRYASITSAIVVAVIIVGLLVVPIPGPSAPISIDGLFGDWASVPKFTEATLASDPNVSIAQYAGFLDRDSLYLFASTRGGTFGDPLDYDGIYFLIDGDGDASTGYSFDGIGADAVVDVFGGNHRVEGARMYSFPSASEVNWSQRQSGGPAQAAASAQGLEAMVSTYDIEGFNPTRFRIGVYADDFRGISSRSKAFLTPSWASILIEVEPLTSVIGIGPTNFFDVRVRALGVPSGTGWGVSNFTFVATSGVTVSFSPGSVVLTQGRPNATVIASISTAGFSPGDLLQVELTGADATHPVVVRGGPVRAYFQSPPFFVRIDGLFADWNGKDHADSDPTRVNNSDVDLVRYGAAVDASSAFFHVSVAGDLLGGRVPERFIRSPPGQSGNASSRPIPLPRQTGEDILRVYIDLNATESQGDPIGGILADYMFEIRGEGGRIRSRSLYAWSTTWIPVALPAVSLAKNRTHIEGSLALGPTTDRTRMVFAATDWAGIGDLTPPANATVQAPAPAPELSGRTISAPEFQEIALPIVFTLAVVLLAVRRRRHSD